MESRIKSARYQSFTLVALILLSLPISTTHAALVDLEISLLENSDPVILGDPLTFNLTVENFGPDSAENTLVEFSTGTGFSGISSNLASCAPGLNFVACDLGTLSPGAFLDFEITGTPIQAGVFNSQATVSSSGQDSAEENNTASQQTLVVESAGADLAAFITATPDPVAPGGRLDYEVSWSNLGPNETSADGLVVFDTGFTLLNFALLGTSADADCSFNATSNALDCSMSNLINGASVLLGISGLSAVSGITSLTTATSIMGSRDNNDANNIALAITQVSAVPVPAAVWLFGTALIGLVGFGRRRKGVWLPIVT